MTFVSIFLGLYIILQCIHIAAAEEKKELAICIGGKLFLTAVFLLFKPLWIFSLCGFFAFYPKKRKYMGPVTTILQSVSVLLFLLICYFQDASGLTIQRIGLMLLLTAVLAVTDIILTRLLQQNRKLYHQIEQTAVNELKVKHLNRDLSIYAQTAERNARLEERENIARNIHNVVGHTITSAIVSLQAYEVLKDSQPERAEDKLSATSERMKMALEEIRRAVRVMDSETEEISIVDFCSLLCNELDKFSTDTEIKIVHNLDQTMKLQQEGSSLLEKRTYEFLHSVLTECLNNGIRHGGATAFFVYLKTDQSHIQLSIADNGCEFQKLSEQEQKQKLEKGYGLRKMKEYVERNGGTMQIVTESGFEVDVMLLRTIK